LIFFTERVADDLEGFQVSARKVQALKGEGTVFDASDDLVARGAGRS
jgi:hypothetical protein